MTFLTTPYVGGRAAALLTMSEILAQGRTRNLRFAVIGDSQEDVTGDAFCDDMSAVSFAYFGKCNETAIGQPTSFGTNKSFPSWWCLAGQGNSTTTKAVADNFIPPGVLVVQNTAHAFLNTRHVFAYRADSQNSQFGNSYDVINPTAGIRGEAFFYTRAAGGATISWQAQKFTGGPPSGNFFRTVVSSGTLAGNLAASDNEPLSAMTPVIPYDAANPYMQILLGSTTLSGMQMAGQRIIGQYDTGGLVWQSFAISGYNTTSVTTNHADAGPMFRLMGGTNGWDAIAVGLTTNNAATLNQNKATYKAALASLISTLRTWNDNTATPIILLSDPASTGPGWPAGALDNFNEYEDAQYELAMELDEVISINSKRLLYDVGYDPTNASYTADGVHPTPLGANIRANVIGRALFSISSGVTTTFPTASEIVAAINADATQTTARTNAATAATQATTAATQATTAATEIGKVHRSATPVAAGAAMRRNAIAATATTLDETVGPTP